MDWMMMLKHLNKNLMTLEKKVLNVREVAGRDIY